ncbi:deferrochelatase/peroxidase EfeB [Microbacterium sp. BE35]|uniref:Dyp-type peroxidase n=1 Tax=Microbacterium sp. BE35 TaxID=2817773 RepID=UPI0028642CFB|nr:Dyp-type peroxidase [Microbacterium sp. BE35]MDR7188199.1 deferrochelatase/peroxidase EfeB [Microbacterium sp. BE35]
MAVGNQLSHIDALPAAMTSPSSPPDQPDAVEFYGPHQGGIADATPTHASFLAFDLVVGAGRTHMAAVLKRWTELGAALAVGDTSLDPSLVSAGSQSALFTLTVGVGGSALDRMGIPRPAALVDLPLFPGDQLDDTASHGDFFVQLCANDAVYLGGAIRAVRAAASGVLAPRWQMNGFRGAHSATSSANGRNLMGQIDGTNNIAVSRRSTGAPVWVDADTPAWMTGGSYVAIRRFRMLLDSWEQTTSEIRDRAVGRHLATGAPLGGTAEFEPVDLAATTSGGAPLIPADAHIRLAAPRRGAGEELLRRSYSYSHGQSTPGGEDAGLIFVSYQHDPRSSFIPVQQRLAESDALNQFTVATSSALFAVLPGATKKGDWLGQALLS